jgi:fatty-acyl-CoA synthase
MTQGRDRTFHEFFREACGRNPRGAALVSGGASYTYEELWEKSGWLARSLLRMGAGPGERVGLWLPNGPELILALIAVSRAGAVGVLINTRFRMDELSYILPHSGVSILICPDSFLDIDFYGLLKEVAPDLRALPGGECTTTHIPSLRRVIALSDTPPEGCVSFREKLEEGKALPAGELERAEKKVLPGDTYLFMYTSGSTSKPKGVLLGHASCARKPPLLAERIGLRPEDRFFTAMPLCHAAGLFSGWWLAVAVAAPLFTASRFDPEEALATMSRERITVERSFPTLVRDQLELLATRKGDSDLSALRTGLASSLSDDIFRHIESRIGPHAYVNNYGFTEATGIVTLSFPEDPPEVRWGKMGKPLEGMEVKIAGPDSGEALSAGESGEIMVRGWAMMKGYHDPPPGAPPAFDGEGWYRTGDLGRLDREGYLTYLGRLRERLRVGGENVSPEEIGVFLRRHPAVEAAEVFGVPDERLDEVPAAVVQRRAGASLTEGEIREYCRQGIAGYKIPRHIRFAEAMPLNSSNKVDRLRLRRDMLAELGLE